MENRALRETGAAAVRSRGRGAGFRGPHPYWLVALAVVLSTAALAGYCAVVRERDQARFRNATEAVQDSIRGRLEAYVSILLATRSLYLAQRGDVDLRDFRDFVAGLDIDRRYPGIQGVGFSRRLLPSELDATLAELRRQGQDGLLRVWPEHVRDEVHSIVFLEPLDRRNRAALGYDMSTEAVRREAMSRARDTGEPAASGKVTLVQEIDPQKQFGFLIYVPVYGGGEQPADPESRRATLLGFVYSPFRVDDLMRGTFGSEREPRVAFDLYDGPEPRPQNLMHRGIAADGHRAQHATVVRLSVAGRPWTLHVEATPGFERVSNRRFLPHLAGIALVINVAYFLAARAQVRAREEEAAARERLAILAETSKRFSEARLELRPVLQAVCREMVSRVGDSCTINLVDEAGKVLELAETSHADPEAEQGARATLADSPIAVGETTVGRVAASGEPLLMPVIQLEHLLRSSKPAYRRHLERFPIGSLAIVPLRAGERIIGTVTVARRAGQRPLSTSDQQLIQDVADRAAFAIENARLAERLRVSTQKAQEAVKLRDEFLAIAGHELRTPLAALQLQVEGLHRQAERGAFGPAPERLLDRLNKARMHVARLEVLIAGLLDVSKIAAGKLALQNEEVDLVGLFGEVVERFAEQADRSKCRVAVDAAEPIVGWWDRVRLDQVFTNLVGNAIKYGAGKPIDVRIARKDGRAEIAVRDHGIGIAPEDTGRIFGRFERAVSDRNYGGLGLGLWISRQIVQAFGGDIRLESELGVGSTFTVELPIRTREDATVYEDGPDRR